MSNYIKLLPNNFFEVIFPKHPNSSMGLSVRQDQYELWQKNNPPIVNYDKPKDIRVSVFLGLSLKDKLNFIDTLNPNLAKTYVEELAKSPEKLKLYEELKQAVEDEEKPKPKEKISKPKKKTIPKALKKSVWNAIIGKDVGTTKCLCCGVNDISQLEFECGHIIAEALGGETKLENLRPICGSCNKSMGIMNMDEFKQKYFSYL